MIELAPPVDRLLSYRVTDFREEWPDYLAEFGFSAEHVGELLRLAVDQTIWDETEPDADGEYPLSSYAAIHARRVLGLLGDASVVTPLFDAMDEDDDFDDYWLEELPAILAKIGPAVIPAVADVLAGSQRQESVRNCAAEALEQIGKSHPEARAECVAVLTSQLAKHDGQQTVNGFIVSALIDLNAVESAEVIEAAFAAGVVEEWIMGDWPEARYRLGLGPMPPPRRYGPLAFSNLSSEPRAKRPDLKKVKQQWKAQKKARQRNRKKR